MKFRFPWSKGDTMATEGIQYCRISLEKLPNSIPLESVTVLLAFEGAAVLKFNNASKGIELSSKAGLIFNHLSIPEIESATPNFSGLIFTLNTNHFIKTLSKIKYSVGKDSVNKSLNMIQIPKSEEVTHLLNSLDCYSSSPFLLSNELIESKIFEVIWLANKLSKFNFDRFTSNYLNTDRIFFDSVLEKYFRQNPSIEQLAEYTGLSPSTFKRKFAKIYKCSPKKWIKNMRLEHAKTMLKYSNKTISEVGYEAGFENISHFIQVFRSTYGATPKSFFSNSLFPEMKNNLNGSLS